MKKKASGPAMSILILVALALGLGLFMVWVNIERVDLAYDIRKMQAGLNRKQALIDKLEVERDNLLSPVRLKKLAKKFGLGPARPGQIRKLKD